MVLNSYFTQNQYLSHFDSIRRQHVKIELLDYISERKIDTLEGYILDGTIEINNNNSIRRTCRLNMILKNDYIPKPNSKIWINRKFRVLIGIESIINEEIHWFNRGKFILNNPESMLSLKDKSISIEGLDYMCLLDGTLSGQLNALKTEIPMGIKVVDAIKNLAQLAGIPSDHVLVETNNYTLPYKIERNSTDTIYSIIKEICELYRTYECYFDENGFLIYRKVREFNTDPIKWNFYETKDALTTEYKKVDDFSNIKNSIYVWGYSKEDGTQIKANLKNENINNPFSIPFLKEERSFVVSDDKIFTNEQALLRAEDELIQHSNLAEKLSIQTLNIYMIDVNNLIYARKEELGIEGKYLIDTISYSLAYNGLMNINTHKIYI